MSRRNSAQTPARRAEKGSARSFLLRSLQQLTVLALAVFGFLYCLITSWQLTVDATGAFGWAAAWIALFFLIFSFRKPALPALAVFALAFFWGLSNADSLLQGALLLMQQAFDPLSLQLPDVLRALLTEHDAQDAAALAARAMAALLFLVTFLAAYFTMHRPCAFGLALATLPLLAPAPFYSRSPALIPFFSLAAAHIMLFARGSSDFGESALSSGGTVSSADAAARRAAHQFSSLFLLPLVVLAALISAWTLPEEGYVRPSSIETLQQKIFSLDFGEGVWKANDGLTHGDFRSLSDIRFTGETVLKARVSQELQLYLRDFAGSVYTNDGWERVSGSVYSGYAADFGAYAPQNLYAALSGSSGSYSLAVQNVNAAALSLWSPAGLITTAGEIENAVVVQDTALAFSVSASGATYELRALSDAVSLSSVAWSGELTADSIENAYLAAANRSIAAASGSESLQSAADAYIGYVFDVYTALPADTYASAQALCQTYGLSLETSGGGIDLYQTCKSLHDLLSSRCVYAYSPTEIPGDVDFTTYFLNESRNGYCVHFATAATVLLRSLGIPARYAEGYIIVKSDYEKETDQNGFFDIEDTHAHAWVEVFDPNKLEWIPVEMTASATGNSGTSQFENTAEPTPTASAGQDITPTPEATATPTQEPTATPESSAEPTSDADATPDTSSDGTEPSTDTPSPDASASPDVSAEPDAQAVETLPDSIDETGGDTGDSEDTSSYAGVSSRPPVWPFLLAGALLMLPMAAIIWRSAERSRLHRKLYQRNLTAAVLAGCKLALHMLRFGGCPAITADQTPAQYAADASAYYPWLDPHRLQTVLEYAQSARFSAHAGTRQERDETLAFTAVLRRELGARLPRVRSWLFRLRFPPL